MLLRMDDDLQTIAENLLLDFQRAQTRVTMLEAIVGMLAHCAFVVPDDGAARFPEFERKLRTGMAELLAKPDFMGAHPIRQDAAFYVDEMLASLRQGLQPPP